MTQIDSGLVYINDVDIYEQFGAFLSEQRKGDRANLKAIYTPSKTKEHVAVSFRERAGEKYASELLVVNEPRDVPLTFCIYAPTKDVWIAKFNAFVAFIKAGNKGWLNVRFPSLNLELRMFYLSCSTYAPLTYLWKDGVQASHFVVKFREPNPAL